MDLHRLKIIMEQEMKSIITQLFVPKIQKRKKKLSVRVFFKVRLSFHQILKQVQDSTNMSRISELGVKNLRTEGWK